MRNKGKSDFRQLFISLSEELGHTKKEAEKTYNIEIERALDSLRKTNPDLVKKLSALKEDELIYYLSEQGSRSKKGNLDPYRFIIWSGIYFDRLKDFKKERGLQEARNIFNSLYSNYFTKKYEKKRFKAPDDFVSFFVYIRLLQEKYPEILRKKLIRKKLIDELKKHGNRDIPISITHEIFRELNPMKVPTSKDLSDIRTKIKRAKQKGFI